ncbi:MAG: PAS domain S-box protein [Syntrophobacteraceae bacterium]
MFWRKLLLSLLMAVILPAAAEGGPDELSVRTPVSSEFLDTLSERERAWLRDHPVIRVVQDPGWPPVEFSDERGEPSGISWEYLSLVERRLGVKFEQVRRLSWQEAYARLKRWEIDMTASVAATPERAQFWAFTKPYMRIPIVIATHPDVPYIADMRELAGKKVAVVEGYAVDDWIPRDFPEIRLVRVKTAREGLETLQRGEVFAYIDNLLIIGHYQAKMRVTNIKISGGTPYENAQSMAVRKDWTIFAGILQKVLDSISETERYDIERKWLPVRYEHGSDYTLLWQVLAVLGALLLGSVFWNRRLSREIRYRKQTEAALKESEEWLSMAMDVGNAGVWRWNLKSDEVHLDAWFHAMLGYAPGELPNTLQEWLPYHHPEEIPIWVSKAEAYLRGDSPVYESEHRIRAKDGAWNWVFTRGRIADLATTGSPEQLIGIAMNVTERKRAEETLADEAVRRRILVEQSRDGIVVLDHNGKVYEANQRYTEMLGYTPEEMRELHAWDWDTQWTREQILEMVRSVDATGDHFETRHRRKDGTVVDVEISSNGAVCGGQKLIFCVCRDITERKQAEEALRQGLAKVEATHRTLLSAIEEQKRTEEALRTSEQRLTDIIDFLPDATFAISSEGIVIAWNHAMEEMTGVPAESMIGKGNFEYSLPFYGRRQPLLIDLVFVGEEEIRKDYQAVSKIGDTIVAEAFVPGTYGGKGAYLWGISKPLYDKSGKFIAAIESIRDITERQLAEETLKKAEAKYRAIFENALEGIFQTTTDGRYIAANPAHAKMLGYDSPDELMSSTADIGRQIYADPARRVEIKRLLTRDGQVKDFHTQLRHRDGTTIWVTIDATSIRSPDGNVLYYQGSMLDITDRKRAEEEREKLEAQLFHAQKMETVGRLAGGVAHDFNNMLGIILGSAEIALCEADPGTPLYESLTEIRKAAHRSADLTRQLLAFARKQTIDPKVLDLNRTVESMLKMLRRLIGEDIDLLWLPGEDLWPVKLDHAQIDQMLANLCVNARDAIKDVGKITIETGNVVLDAAYCAARVGFPAGDYVMLAVSDDGCGMCEEARGRLFEPFFTTKGLGKGTGLGLAMVYGIVKQNQGLINVYSEPGLGTTFKIYIPRHAAAIVEARAEGASEFLPGRGEVVLLVEDEPALLRMSREMLEKLGYTVLSAATTGEAMRLAEEHDGEIHLLLTDVVMPEMNGRDLAKRLLANKPGTKCLFMSGYTANVIAHHGVLEEGVKFIQKPFSMRDLSAKVREALDEKSK